MNKIVSIWVIRLNSFIIELRATVGPIKIIRSSMKKPGTKRSPAVDNQGYHLYDRRGNWKMKDVPTTIVFKHTAFVGGRHLANISPATLRNRIGGISFAKDDVVKLTASQAKRALDYVRTKGNTKGPAYDNE